MKIARNFKCPKHWGDQKTSLFELSAGHLARAFSLHGEFIARTGIHRPSAMYTTPGISSTLTAIDRG